MLIYEGKSVYGGIAIGKIKFFQNKSQTVKRIHTPDTASELSRFKSSVSNAEKQLKQLYNKACTEVGTDNAAIFEIHQIMLNDDDFLDSIENIIAGEEVNAEYAVAVTGDNFSKMFASMEDAYIRARAADVKDISERLIRILSGVDESGIDTDEPVIIVAEDIAPSETVQLDKSKVLAFVTAKGSANSHTSILARTMNIPAIIGAEITDEHNGSLAVVDGFSGKVYINPDEELLLEMKNKVLEEKEKRELLNTLRGKENITLDGTKVDIFANIGNVSDLALVLENDADGIGLFRSEFIYLERDSFPTEDEQFAIYKSVAQTMGDKKVIIRTLDIGADKQADYFCLCKEENPAMGLRAIRLCLTRPDIFKVQLKALFRAAVFGNISIMYPMITSVNEIKAIKNIVAEVEQELRNAKISYRVPEQGIMIETPAAAILSDKLANEVSFFSIGTNDLSQYTMAIDRQNSCLDEFFDPHSEAVMRMIELTVKNAHNAGIWVGICGELGADTSMTERFLRMGVDELSVSPPKVLSVRKRVRELNLGI
ncbi:MAG: phosphoenolpyruvate--protein phosphotransferase [Eubacteriales bacterium]|nr:phosphoenolpyruvate--protein phosphotransferase [Eubacteriales bacterium]